ncbi:photosystem I reaction center subunit PsaK [Argonema antarcticum]|uniref:photosystem I reaction center subunit PsaK n=1 Tax=Argonema antarcticum TaxID=2942763 RepID=UPI00201130F4|nr:photosystem I reaction center subunit PsaK [Argonema antarcticum]MCL1469721.1 photosystem I reaction center subunit PsaK [Argonema antarcticum A004/B2]
MINSIVLAVQATVPNTPAWSPTIGLVMIICNILGLAIARFATQDRGSKPPSPIPTLGFPQLLAGTSFGHILGAGVILGLTNVGAI